MSDHKWPVESLQNLTRLTNLRALDLRGTIDGNGVWRRKDALTVAKLGLVYFALTTEDLSAETLRLFKDVGLYYKDGNIDPILKKCLKHPA